MGYYEAVATYIDAELEKKRELFLVEAETCSDAEYIVMQYMAGFAELNVVSVKLTRVVEVHTDKSIVAPYGLIDNRWYSCKMSQITINDAGKKKKSAFLWMVCTETTASANVFLENELNSTINDWEINSITETKIVEFLKKDTPGRNTEH